MFADATTGCGRGSAAGCEDLTDEVLVGQCHEDRPVRARCSSDNLHMRRIVVSQCGCMCAAASHYSICQADAEPNLCAAPGQPVVVQNSPVCRPCHDASLTNWKRPWPARSGQLSHG
jgi:hypothetical protein